MIERANHLSEGTGISSVPSVDTFAIWMSNEVTKEYLPESEPVSSGVAVRCQEDLISLLYRVLDGCGVVVSIRVLRSGGFGGEELSLSS